MGFFDLPFYCCQDRAMTLGRYLMMKFFQKRGRFGTVQKRGRFGTSLNFSKSGKRFYVVFGLRRILRCEKLLQNSRLHWPFMLYPLGLGLSRICFHWRLIRLDWYMLIFLTLLLLFSLYR